jgi:hypothetical protein
VSHHSFSTHASIEPFVCSPFGTGIVV